MFYCPMTPPPKSFFGTFVSIKNQQEPSKRHQTAFFDVFARIVKQYVFFFIIMGFHKISPSQSFFIFIVRNVPKYDLGHHSIIKLLAWEPENGPNTKILVVF